MVKVLNPKSALVKQRGRWVNKVDMWPPWKKACPSCLWNLAKMSVLKNFSCWHSAQKTDSTKPRGILPINGLLGLKKRVWSHGCSLEIIFLCKVAEKTYSPLKKTSKGSKRPRKPSSRRMHVVAFCELKKERRVKLRPSKRDNSCSFIERVEVELVTGIQVGMVQVELWGLRNSVRRIRIKFRDQLSGWLMGSHCIAVRLSSCDMSLSLCKTWPILSIIPLFLTKFEEREIVPDIVISVNDMEQEPVDSEIHEEEPPQNTLAPGSSAPATVGDLVLQRARQKQPPRYVSQGQPGTDQEARGVARLRCNSQRRRI